MKADGGEQTRKLASPAWLRRGGLKGVFILPDPGLLLAVGDRVSFVTKTGPVFEADRAEIKVSMPRRELGGGLHLTVGGKVYLLSLVRPNGAPKFDETMREALKEFAFSQLTQWTDVVMPVLDIHRGRANAKIWKAYFRGETAEAAAGPETIAQPETAAGPEATPERATGPETAEGPEIAARPETSAGPEATPDRATADRGPDVR